MQSNSESKPVFADLNQEFYYYLRLIRRIEETIVTYYPSDKIKSPVHLSVGQEGAAVALGRALTKNDGVFSSYRCHGIYLALGGSPRKMMAELFGKQDGCGAGKAGSMHLNDPSSGLIASSAIVGTNIPLAVGFGLAQKLKRSGHVAVAMFGDGAVDEGATHESLLLAKMQKLPVLFFCEDNDFAIHSRSSTRHGGNASFIADWARGYEIPVTSFSNDDVEPLYHSLTKEIASIRQNPGPRFVVTKTARWLEHVGIQTDFHLGYRNRDELTTSYANDPVETMGSLLEPHHKEHFDKMIEATIIDALAFAEASSFPEPSQLFADQYGDTSHGNP